jgi:pre-mRNA-processing factor 19
MLIDIKNVSPQIKPRPSTATSIPALLKSLQDEWDATMLYSFTLRQQLQTARQELSHALYQHDAACRVIARLTKENVAAREALATLKPQSSTNGVAVVPQTVYASESANGDKTQKSTATTEEGLTEDVIQKLQEKASVLTQTRKQKGKKQPENLATIDDLKAFKCTASHVGLHSASAIGILSIDIQFNNPNKVVTGGVDKTAVVFNNSTERIEATLKGHTKKVTQCIYHPDEDLVITGSADNTIRVWDVPNSQCTQVFKFHDGNITGLSLHPVGDYLLSCSLDDHWAFSDIRSGRLYVKCPSDEKSNGGLTCAKFHPDGLIFGIGTSDSVIKIWDLKERTNVANFPGHSGAITSLAFSENGYYLATSAEDSVIKLWDLRKLKNFKTIQLEDNFEVKDLSFDYSGSYLACAGTDVRIYQVKQWDVLKTFNDHTALATGVRFGTNAKTLITASMDRSLKFYGLLKKALMFKNLKFL